MEYNKQFGELIEKLPDNEYVGLGNPNAKILFIGKEAGADIGSEAYHGHAKSWKEKQFDYSKRYIPTESKLRNLNHTWQRYEKLNNLILLKLGVTPEVEKSDKYEITFVENVFTTELSNLPAKSTKEAKKQIGFKQELEKRKQLFFNSEFIEQFPIVVIFASDNQYIETYPGEVVDLFKVSFDKKQEYDGRDSIWIHSSTTPEKGPKLLIHTRQLTNSISPELIESISNLIVDFIRTKSISI